MSPIPTPIGLAAVLPAAVQANRNEVPEPQRGSVNPGGVVRCLPFRVPRIRHPKGWTPNAIFRFSRLRVGCKVRGRLKR